MNKILALLLAIVCASCGKNPEAGTEMKEETKFWSPSGNYYITTSIQDNPGAKYLCVKIHLFSKVGVELSHLQTNASDRMKWALGWLEEKDTVVLYSSDIGTYAYNIGSANQLIKTEVSGLVERGRALYQNKYQK